MVKVYAAKAALEQLAVLRMDYDDVQSLEKMAFLLKLLSKNLHLDYSDSEVVRLNQSRLPKAFGFKVDQAEYSEFERRLFRWRLNSPNSIQGKKELIESMRNGVPVATADLPQYLILNADAELCRKRMEQYGVVCIGITATGIHLDSDSWKEYSESTKDLFSAFCDLLAGLKRHVRFFRVFDQHFFSNYNSLDYRKIYQSIPHSACRVGIHFCADPKNRGSGAKTIGRAEVIDLIAQRSPALLPKIELVTDGMNRFDNHDRYIVSSCRVYISGNSFSKPNCQTYIHSYPLAAYYENLPEKIRKMIAEKGV